MIAKRAVFTIRTYFVWSWCWRSFSSCRRRKRFWLLYTVGRKRNRTVHVRLRVSIVSCHQAPLSHISKHRDKRPTSSCLRQIACQGDI